MRVLDELEDGRALRVVDVARDLGLSSSTAHRLLSTLRECGYLRQQTGSSRYEAGPAALRLARRLSAERALERISLPYLQALCEQVNETVNVEVLVASDVLFVASVEDQHRLRVARRVGTRGPAYANAGGKVLLAGLTDSEVRTLVGETLQALSPRTIGSVDALIAELREIRRRGYALNAGETDEGVRAISVPILGADSRPLAALSLAAPEARLPAARMTQVLPALRATAAAISEEYGGAKSRR